MLEVIKNEVLFVRRFNSCSGGEKDMTLNSQWIIKYVELKVTSITTVTLPNKRDEFRGSSGG